MLLWLRLLLLLLLLTCLRLQPRMRPFMQAILLLLLQQVWSICISNSRAEASADGTLLLIAPAADCTWAPLAGS